MDQSAAQITERWLKQLRKMHFSSLRVNQTASDVSLITEAGGKKRKKIVLLKSCDQYSSMCKLLLLRQLDLEKCMYLENKFLLSLDHSCGLEVLEALHCPSDNYVGCDKKYSMTFLWDFPGMCWRIQQSFCVCLCVCIGMCLHICVWLFTHMETRGQQSARVPSIWFFWDKISPLQLAPGIPLYPVLQC